MTSQIHFKKVALLGVGLLGGSLGLEIKKAKLADVVVGFGRSQKNLLIAKKRKLIDQIAGSLPEAINGADLVLLCSPVSSVVEHIYLVAKLANPGCLIMDVGSTKNDIMLVAAREIPSDVFFVGAHPMAGTEEQGAKAAIENLFKDKKCLLTYLPKTKVAIKKRAALFWKLMGSKVIVLESGKHDEYLAFTSHLPQITAYSLMDVIGSRLNIGLIKSLSGGGFRDTTRIAASPASVWLDICQTNSKNLIEALKALRGRIDWVIRQLETRKWNRLETFFNHASKLRRKL